MVGLLLRPVFERFVENDLPWAHLDIAGKAWADKASDIVPKGGTGFGGEIAEQAG